MKEKYKLAGHWYTFCSCTINLVTYCICDLVDSQTTTIDLKFYD